MKDTVAGLELFAVKGTYGTYLRCDSCGATLDNNVAEGRIIADEEVLQQEARKLGWTGSFSRDSCEDRCTACSGMPLEAL